MEEVCGVFFVWAGWKRTGDFAHEYRISISFIRLVGFKLRAIFLTSFQRAFGWNPPGWRSSGVHGMPCHLLDAMC